MWRVALAVVAVGLLAGVAGAAAPPPNRTQALFALADAIEDEQFALDRLQRKPPRWRTAHDRLYGVPGRLWPVVEYASSVGATQAERDLETARTDDWYAEDQVLRALGERPYDLDEAIRRLKRALRLKRAALVTLRTAKAAARTPQCADGKDNDGDGSADAKLDPGCTSAADTRERSPFTCLLRLGLVRGRLAVDGSCSGPFAEVEYTVLDGVLNGRYDVGHAPACGAPTPTRVRCKAKDGAQNPRHLVDARFTSTSTTPGSRVRLRFFDVRKRQIGRFVVQLP